MMHFWLREEGDIGREAMHERPIAKLIDGSFAHYHFCGANRQSTDRILRAGVFRWRYLGAGEIYVIGGITQYFTRRDVARLNHYASQGGLQ